MKSDAKRSRNNFVRGVRAETALRAYTVALGYVQTRDADQAKRLLEERIDFYRQELREVNVKRTAARADGKV